MKYCYLIHKNELSMQFINIHHLSMDFASHLPWIVIQPPNLRGRYDPFLLYYILAKLRIKLQYYRDFSLPQSLKQHLEQLVLIVHENKVHNHNQESKIIQKNDFL